MRTLIAGIGNLLRGDDGFGPAVIRALEEAGPVPGDVTLIELGIGGMGLVQELLERYDALIVVDAIERQAAPGELFVLRTDTPDVESLSPAQRYALAADLHQLVPDRALVVARAAGVLPRDVWLVGCQPAETEEFSQELSPRVRGAVPRAVAAIKSLLADLRDPAAY